jgi:uncharacterized damage-inducible protein DinB
MTEKEMFLNTWNREFQTTLKVLKAYPSIKLDLKPHERSRSAQDLAWTFVMEEAITDSIVKGKIDFSQPMPKPPASFDEIISAFQGTHTQMYDRVKNLSDADYNATIKFPVAPGEMGDLRRADVLWTMLMDSVHHRGQFSVYLRMAGGKVPSIYGPSADEPWM